MRTPLVQPGGREHASPFERLKQELETADCETSVFWRSELRQLAPTLAPDETVELIVPALLADEPARRPIGLATSS
jgi:hypothetical protein